MGAGEMRRGAATLMYEALSLFFFPVDELHCQLTHLMWSEPLPCLCVCSLL